MRITKKINNNVALAEDGAGKALVVFGKGVGFPATPYELTDLSVVERTFYDIKASYVGLAASLPEKVILLSADIVEMAQAKLGCDLNPNLPFTLADHINFAVERAQNGLEVAIPMAYDVANFYPKEVEIARWALEEAKGRLGQELPQAEVVNIALHLVNGEMEHSDMHSTLAATQIIRDVTDLVEDSLHIQLDQSNFNYSRFVMHLRFLLQRLESDAQEVTGMSAALRQMSVQYPDVYRCTMKVRDYLNAACGKLCNQDELLYLFMHINRLKQRNGSEGEGRP